MASTQTTPSKVLYKQIENHQWPIVYRSEYNISLLGIEKLHPFDAQKWRHIFQFLKKAGLIDEERVVSPNMAQTSDLLSAHSCDYLKSLKWSCTIARITEMWPLMLLPSILIKRSYLNPMRYQTGGSVLAGHLALERGWAINLGGGFHHSSRDSGGGFCPYADISLLIYYLFHYDPRVSRAMIIDLDAHQGNGHAKDFINEPNVYIMDVYNAEIYPKDSDAKRGIQRKIEFQNFTGDDEYLEEVEKNLECALQEFHPDIIVYNAGTDVLVGDRLGRLSITSHGIVRRDQLVFMKARERRVPIVMLTSGGYQKCTARIIADSILNLYELGLIEGPTPTLS